MFMNAEEQLKIILKGTHEVANMDNLREKLDKSIATQEPLIIKLGLDPSAPDIHLGHAVILRKLKQLQDIGHQIVIIIGDFTGKIGDPTGKSKGRVALTEEEVQRNALTYTNQIFKILDVDKTQVRFNSTWLSKLTLEDIIRLSATTTVARILEREDFKNRYNNNTPIGLHEFFYPLMQAYDSVELKADIEFGGTDQTFNILMGRALQKHYNQESQVAIFMPILEGLDGIEKMSKSLGNYIGINEDATTMFKKVMEVPDSLIIRYYTLATDIHADKISYIEEELNNGRNPRDIKLELAKEITSLYHSEEDVEKAILFYHQAFSKKVIPDDVNELFIKNNSNTLTFIELIKELVDTQYSSSSSELRRMVNQGGVQLNGEKMIALDSTITSEDILRIGKKQFVKIIIQK